MDGLDLSEIDQDVFNRSHSDSEECDEMPLPDCIGIDSAVQDDEETRVARQRLHSKSNSRTEAERKLELQVLRPDSIRRQILEKSLNNNNASVSGSKCSEAPKAESHVMNITEKAGMSGIDKDRINRIIHEASKGSLFYKRQAQRQAEIHKSIERMLNRVKAATPAQVDKARVTCDKLVAELQRQRVFNRVIVHFDLDMFFAAVEIRDNPNLKDKAVAVGGDSMVSTSNYIARKFGVRAAMPGFIARKLCPELILIKPNGFKYREASSEVFAILEQYDPELTGMSLDEAYLDLTEYVKNTLERDNLEFQEHYDGTLPPVWWTRAAEVVEEIRQAIFDKTKLTCSAGISCNTLLAKISTDINKPDGQFMVKGYPRDVSDFIGRTLVEKVSGIGKVSAQFLNALDIKTCGDIFEKRHYLPLVFYEINVKFYLRVALGDGSTSIKSDEQRKSKSVERTFSAIKDTLILLDKLDNICEELCSKYLKPYRIRGRTVTVKLKRNTFMTTTKSYSMLVPTNDKLVIYSAAKNLLLSEIANEAPEISYRLLGVKLSNLADDGVTTNQLTIDAMLRNQDMGKPTKSETQVHTVDDSKIVAIDSPEGSSVAEFVSDDQESTISLKIMSPSAEPTPVEITGGSSNKKIKTSATKLSHQSANKTIKSFFSQRQTRSNSTKVSPAKQDERKTNATRVDDAPSDTSSRSVPMDNLEDLNLASQQEQVKNEPNSEDFQCPYCFKSFVDFDELEKHVDNCNMKIPIDVNRSFFSQRSQHQQSPASVYFSQFKPGGEKSAGSHSVRKSARIKRQPRKKSPLNVSVVTPDLTSRNSCRPPRSDDRKISFFERFIESNSQSLKQSSQIEPLQCPYCRHGFLNFASLKTHVVMCTKKGNVDL